MLYPTMSDLLDKVSSRYFLVNIAAQRAREIAIDEMETGIHIDDKPVTHALREIAEGTIDPADYTNKD